MTSDAGLLLLAEHATCSGDIARIATALAPKLKAPASGDRKPRAPEHSTAELLTQRVMQMIGGYPDGNDSNLLRHDPVLQMLVGKAAPGTPEATLASQPTMSRLDNGFSLRQLVRAFDAMVDNFIASYAGKAPDGLVLDLDPTACIVYGQQELGMFSTHVGDTCLMPFHLYEGQSGRLIAAALHPGKTPTAKAIIGILRRVVKKLRKVWPRLPLIEDIYCGRGRAELYIKDHKLGLVSDRLSCTRKEGNAMRLLCSSLAYQVIEGFLRVSLAGTKLAGTKLAGTKLARATFGEVRIKLFNLAARVRVMKTRVEVHLASKHPGSRLVAQIIGQALRVIVPRTASTTSSSG